MMHPDFIGVSEFLFLPMASVLYAKTLQKLFMVTNYHCIIK